MSTLPGGGEAVRDVAAPDAPTVTRASPAAPTPAQPVSLDVETVDVGQPDHDAEFAAFMASAAPALGRTAWLLCGDAHRAEELVQQALVRTYLAWPRARAHDPLAYARRVLANQRIDTWRRRRREVLTSPRDVPEGGAATADELYADRDLLVRALATLTPRQRRVVVLRHMAGLSEREVADDLGVSLGTVKSTSSRGLRRLRAVLVDRAETADVVADDGEAR